MAERTLPGLGLTGFWEAGSDNWKSGMDDNLLKISVVLGQRALSMTTSLPSSGNVGDIYIIPEGDTRAGQIAAWDGDPGDREWVFIVPSPGFTFFVEDEDLSFLWKDGVWTALVSEVIEPPVDPGVVETLRVGSLTPSSAGALRVPSAPDGTYGVFTVSSGLASWSSLPTTESTLTDIPGYEVKVLPGYATALDVTKVDELLAAVAADALEVRYVPEALVKSVNSPEKGDYPVLDLTNAPSGVTYDGTNKTWTIGTGFSGEFGGFEIVDQFLEVSAGPGFSGIRGLYIDHTDDIVDFRKADGNKPFGAIMLNSGVDVNYIRETHYEASESAGHVEVVIWSHANVGVWDELSDFSSPRAALDHVKLNSGSAAFIMQNSYLGIVGSVKPATYTTSGDIEYFVPGTTVANKGETYYYDAPNMVQWIITAKVDGVTAAPADNGTNALVDGSEWFCDDIHPDNSQTEMFQAETTIENCVLISDKFGQPERVYQASAEQTNNIRCRRSTQSPTPSEKLVVRSCMLENRGPVHPPIFLDFTPTMATYMTTESIDPATMFTPVEVTNCLIGSADNTQPDPETDIQNYVTTAHPEAIGLFTGNVDTGSGLAIAEITGGIPDRTHTFSGGTEVSSVDLGVLPAGTYSFEATLTLTGMGTNNKFRISSQADLNGGTQASSTTGDVAASGTYVTGNVVLASPTQMYAGVRAISAPAGGTIEFTGQVLNTS